MERPKQRDCRYEVPYPEHQTVLFNLSAPDWTTHFPTDRCTIEEPHLIENCGEFKED